MNLSPLHDPPAYGTPLVKGSNGDLYPRCSFSPDPITNSPVTDWYSGQCPHTGKLLRLPRTWAVEAMARELMQGLAADERFQREGKMYGVLLVEEAQGRQRVLKAFSGLLNQEAVVPGWVPPIPGREQVAIAETKTLTQLNQIRDQLLDRQAQLQDLNREYEVRSQTYDQHWQTLKVVHAQRKQQRQEQRQHIVAEFSGEQQAQALAELDEQSRADKREQRIFKCDRNARLNPLHQAQTQLQSQIQALKQERKALSRQLQTQMHQSYWLQNFSGTSVPLQQLFGREMPTGTGDCCAPKLLHYAATQNLKPLAMAEFWWGEAKGDKIPGQFYGACVERCQPLMGFLLSGLSTAVLSLAAMDRTLEVVYEDEVLVAVDKPAGLLSVPGRSLDRQESALLRLQAQLGRQLWPIHRLDQDTSGILLFAKSLDIYKQVSQQFQTRQVQKIYTAILSGCLTVEAGLIDLPLWGDPQQRPRQSVNWEHGKPSQTYFQVLRQSCDRTWVQFQPITGRTHQIRVHAADPEGLGIPILGDRLYSNSPEQEERLYLHAERLTLQHPLNEEPLNLIVQTLPVEI